MSENKEPDLLKRIIKLVKRTGGEVSNFQYALKFHLKVLVDSKTEPEIESEQELCEYLFSKMFLDKMELYPTQPFKCQMDEYSDWPLMPLPAVNFGNDNNNNKETEKQIEKQKDADKIMWFYASLKEGDILDCRVAEVLPIMGYHLNVIKKFGVPHNVEDLHLKVFLKFVKNESRILEKPLLVCEFVRVAVFKIETINNVVQSVYVTVDPALFEVSSNFRSVPKLGRITESDVPSYDVDKIPDTENFSRYSHYLISKPQFYNSHYYIDLIEGCGMDPTTVSSYFPEYNRQPSIEGQSGQDLLKLCEQEDATILAKSALKRASRHEYDGALQLLQDALKICPKEDDALMGRLYDIRSDIYSKQMKTIYSVKSLWDLEMAYKFATKDKDGGSIKQKLLHQIFKVANGYYRDKQYKNAALGFEFVVKNDENHRLAARVLDRIKKVHADQLLNLEEMSQIDLQEKKKELLTELKKIKTL